jgi:hypothetical protein
MKVGFAGSRKAMTAVQKDEVRQRREAPGTTEVHHGGCTGADADPHAIALELRLAVVLDPLRQAPQRAFCRGDKVLPQRDDLHRNHDIVDTCAVLLATPTAPERLRSGTWATVRAAVRKGRQTVGILPEGAPTTAAGLAA